MYIRSVSFLCVLFFACLTSGFSFAVDVDTSATIEPPCAFFNADRSPFFGDTHVHTRYSLDASTQDTRTRPIEAYDFARGTTIGIQPWTDEGKALREVNIGRALDFAVVTDHAELFGEVNICNTEGMEGHGSWQCLVYRWWPRGAFYLFNYYASVGERLGFCGEDGELCRQAGLAPWQEMQEAAEAAYDRTSDCSFTSFVGYEWTGVGENTENLHRNIIFRNTSVPQFPISAINGPTAEQLWDQLDEECINADTGCDAIIIPHNSNISGGLMFQTVRNNGNPISAEDAAQRNRLERLVEVMQHKGSSECFFGAGYMADELCAFEQLPYKTFRDKFQPNADNIPAVTDGFLREVMNTGLEQETRIGVNPFKWGFIGSTDTHLGTPGLVDERDFPGHGGAGAPAEEGATQGLTDDLEYNPGGLAVLWAEQNNRESLFSAMRRREAYGTSGPRMLMRFYAGKDIPQDMCSSENFAATGYANGVTMGADLPGMAEGEAPRFAVMAAKDAGTAKRAGMPLQRVQIIKGWLDQDGKTHQKVIDVAGDANNGAGVDTNTCETYGEGFNQLCTTWVDEEFSSTEKSWYYARVVENPSCRWSQHICVANQVDCSNPDAVDEGLQGCCSVDHRKSIQERGWSSPIWYSPELAGAQ
ncbi:MAG: DUF3604 domain-containing protein [Pseudomonadales bacterium]